MKCDRLSNAPLNFIDSNSFDALKESNGIRDSNPKKLTSACRRATNYYCITTSAGVPDDFEFIRQGGQFKYERGRHVNREVQAHRFAL